MWETVAIIIGILGFLSFIVIIVYLLGGQKRLIRLVTKRTLELEEKHGYSKMPSGKRYFILDNNRKKEIMYFKDQKNGFKDLFDEKGKLIKTVHDGQLQFSEKTANDLFNLENVNHYYLIVDEESSRNYLRNEIQAYKLDNFRLEQERLRLLARMGEYNNELAKQKGKEYKSEYGDRRIVVMKSNSKKPDEYNKVEVE